MLGIKDVLLGANTSTPALNEFAKLVADKLPQSEVGCRELACTVTRAAIDVKNDPHAQRDDYPNLYDYVNKGGEMCALSARLTEVIDSRAPAEYAKNYKVESKLYFGV